MTDNTKKPFKLNYADTGSDVDMTAQEIETVKKEVNVNVTFKPNPKIGFIRMHEKVFPLYCIDIERPNNADTKDRYYLQMSKEDLEYLARKHGIKKVHFTLCITPSGTWGFWGRSVKFGNEAVTKAAKTGHAVWQEAQKKWIKVGWDKPNWCYYYEDPLDKSIFPTDEELQELWPSEDFDLLLAKGLEAEDLILTSLEDGPIQRVLGKKL